MRTININLYKYDELSPQAKEKALEHYSDINTDYEWWDCTYFHWRDKLEEQGFSNPKIYFSGFWSQGDGACFDADIDFDTQFEQYRNYALSNGTGGIQRAIKNHKNWIYDYLYNETRYSIAVINHQYSHESTRQIESYCYTDTKGMLSEIYSDFEEWLESKRTDLCREIYRDLKQEYGYLSGKECIEETLRVNEYEFTQEGKAA